MTKERKQEIIATYRRDEKDTGPQFGIKLNFLDNSKLRTISF